MSYTFSKNEKLKNKKEIDNLFSQQQSIIVEGIRVVYLVVNEDFKNTKAGFSVSKRFFKNATDRNTLKRRMREAYRLNKNLLNKNTKHILFIYTAKKIEKSSFIHKQIISLLEKLNQI